MLDIILVILFIALAIFVGVKAANKNNCVGLNLPSAESLPVPAPIFVPPKQKYRIRHLYWREIPPQYLKLTIKNTHDGHFSVFLQGLKNPSYQWSIQATNRDEAFKLFCNYWVQLSVALDQHFLDASLYYTKSHTYNSYGLSFDQLDLNPDTEDEPTVIG